MALIVAGSRSGTLAGKVSAASGIPVLEKIIRRFPDGELYVRLAHPEKLKGERVFVVHTMYPGQNESLVELLLTLGLIRDCDAEDVRLVVPYMAYARQDRRFQEGESFSLMTTAKLLASLGVSRVIFIDAHFVRRTEPFDFHGMRAKSLTAVPLLIGYAKKRFGGNLLIVGPDEGSMGFLSGTGATFLKKEKRCPVCGKPADRCTCSGSEKRYEAKITVPDGLKGRRVLLLDDMVTTGTTIVQAAKALEANGNEVYVGCTHGIFLGASLEELKKHAKAVFCTDTVESAASVVSVAGLIAEELKKETV